MGDLAEACSKVIKFQSSERFMEFFGHCFVQYFSHYGYDKIVRVAGRHYRDFLRGIDNLHETMRFSFPKMSTPSFYVTEEHPQGCCLHYRSHRQGFTHYVIGQLKQCALKFYNTPVEIQVIQEEKKTTSIHVIYQLYFDNNAYVPKNVSPLPGTLKSEFSTISSSAFFKVSTRNYFSFFIRQGSCVSSQHKQDEAERPVFSGHNRTKDRSSGEKNTRNLKVGENLQE